MQDFIQLCDSMCSRNASWSTSINLFIISCLLTYLFSEELDVSISLIEQKMQRVKVVLSQFKLPFPLNQII